MERKNDFTKGSIQSNIMQLAVPMIAAQLINVLYSVVDRIYIGHLPDASTLALTGLGITFPIIMAVTAFANLFGMGGAPLCSIARGKGDDERAERIMGNSFSMLLMSGVLLMVLFLLFKGPILYLFGASDQTFPYANDYVSIYICGSIFVMTGLGMNSFINAQGFAKIGMMTVMLGAVVNIVLDPIFIFIFDMGVQGAALATIIAQLLSCLWVLRFLTSKKAIYRIRLKYMRLDRGLVGEITALGMSGFIIAITNSAVQVVCNASLQHFGGDIYVGVMTVLNSIREVLTMPIQGLTNGAQPVLGFNYGAGAYNRVRKGIQFTTILGVSYAFVAWVILMLTPQMFIHLFNSEPELIRLGVPALYIYFFGFFILAFQFSGQSVFIALGRAKEAIFFSLLRKAIIVIPLTIFLPNIFNLGVNGVFLAEPISNFIGGAACFITMMVTVWARLKEV